MKPSAFFMSEKSQFGFHFWKLLLLDIEFEADSFNNCQCLHLLILTSVSIWGIFDWFISSYGLHFPVFFHVQKFLIGCHILCFLKIFLGQDFLNFYEYSWALFWNALTNLKTVSFFRSYFSDLLGRASGRSRANYIH